MRIPAKKNFFLLTFLFSSAFSQAETQINAEEVLKDKHKNHIGLATLNSSENNKTGFGIDFDLKDFEVGFAKFSARGTYSLDDEIRSQDMMQFDLDIVKKTTGECYKKDPKPDQQVDIPVGTLAEGDGPTNHCALGAWFFTAGLGYETDQDFDNKNSTADIAATWIMPSYSDGEGFHVFQPLYSLLDFIPGVIRSTTGFAAGENLLLEEPVISFKLATVDPQEDETREQLLGKLKSYYRGEAEFSMTTPVAKFYGKEVKFSYDYRYFKEINAEDAIKTENLHRSRLSQFSFSIPTDKNENGYAFVGYSSGRLPFGVDDEILQLGWSYQL